VLYDRCTWLPTTRSPGGRPQGPWILLTDGEDQGSRLKIKDAIEAAQKAGTTICYVLLIADRGFYGFGGYGGDSAMKN